MNYLKKQAIDKKSKEHDNVETRNLYPLITKFLKEVADELNDDFSYSLELDKIEFNRRDGFIPHSHNRGGMDLINLVDMDKIYHQGVESPAYILNMATRECEQRIADIKFNNPEADEDNVDMLFYESIGDYDQYARRVRVMYEGDGLIVIHYGWDTDAPYFRWNSKSTEIEIKFRTKAELKTKLAKAVRKVVKGLEG